MAVTAALTETLSSATGSYHHKSRIPTEVAWVDCAPAKDYFHELYAGDDISSVGSFSLSRYNDGVGDDDDDVFGAPPPPVIAAVKTFSTGVF